MIGDKAYHSKVCAIILNHNSSTDCSKCLRFLRQQKYNNLDIVIVDNASSDKNEIAELKKLTVKYNAQLIINSRNNGFSAGNNIGIKRAIEQKADWCLIINPDVELRDIYYIDKVLNVQKKWSEAIVIGSDIRLPNGERQNPQRESTFWEALFWPMEEIKRKIKRRTNIYLQDDATGYCDKVCGACFFIRTAAAIEMDFLDENVFMYSEEAILSAKVKSLGKKILYVSGVIANHEHYSTKKAKSSDRMQKFLISREYYYVNYGNLNSVQLIMIRISLFLEKMYWYLLKK